MTVALQARAGSAITLDLTPDRSLSAQHRRAVLDVCEAAALWRLCCTLSWLDIKLRYRGSMLGPFWLTLSTGVMVGAMGFIYSALFHVQLHDYLPFIALSLVLWNFLGTLVGDGCQGFTSAEGMIRSMRMPYSLYAARIVLRNLIVLAHNILVIIVVDVLLDTWPGAGALLLVVPGFVLWLVDGLAISLLLGAVCARFRDIPPIVGSVMQMAFFVTPVIWQPSAFGASRMWLLPFNPFYTLLEIVRGPLLGLRLDIMVYVSAVGFSVLLVALTWLLFTRVRGRIAFWV
jgi:lipopolysaccharide transport system permease protein